MFFKVTKVSRPFVADLFTGTGRKAASVSLLLMGAVFLSSCTTQACRTPEDIERNPICKPRTGGEVGGTGSSSSSGGSGSTGGESSSAGGGNADASSGSDSSSAGGGSAGASSGGESSSAGGGSASASAS